jgi:hypothetical protein
MFEDEHLQPMVQNMMIISTCVLEPSKAKMLLTLGRFGSGGGVLATACCQVVGPASPCKWWAWFAAQDHVFIWLYAYLFSENNEAEK